LDGQSFNPTARAGLAVVTVNNKIYAIGGHNGDGTYLDVVEEYNPVTNTWAVKKGLTVGRDAPAVTEMNGKIYVIGGWNRGYLNSLEEYTPSADMWTIRAGMVTPRHSSTAVTVNGADGKSIYVIGGENYFAGGYLDSVEKFKIEGGN
jgi:N-acetylneuraminic acid mutarotase